jgi:CDP-diacylglycerol--glycerol-3-phosphate 3-phosphatidyltransferase
VSRKLVLENEPNLAKQPTNKMSKLKPPFDLNMPMVLTWARIAMIPLVIGVFYLPESWLSLTEKNVTACVLFVLAAITDALDGYLARRYAGWATPAGAFLDPVADKLIVSAALVALVGLGRCDMLIAMVIIAREITVSALREWMAKLGESGKVKVNWFGKIKTIAQMVAIPSLLWWDPIVVNTSLISGAINIALIGEVLLYVAAVLTIYSMYVYLRAARSTF